MKVAEKFVSINGEGKRAGELAVFIRFCGCNLNCTYCDTKWANEKDAPFKEETPQEIAAYVKDKKVKCVTLTGGEPMLQKDLGKLVDLLIEEGLEVEIETNGSIDISKLGSLNRPAFTIDYKSPSSGCESKMDLGNYKHLEEKDCVKFVVGNVFDLSKARSIIDSFDLTGKCGVYLSPVFGMIEPSTIVDYMKKYKMNNVKLQLQMHKAIWDPNMKGV